MSVARIPGKLKIRRKMFHLWKTLCDINKGEIAISTVYGCENTISFFF
jgi:hypothetical protein